MNTMAAQIRERLPAREVVEFYGFHPNGAGFIRCPFHAGDDHGSLKVYSGGKAGWHCFGCGAGGSVIDFVMRLFDLSFRQACTRLNADFRLGLTGEHIGTAERSAILEARRREAERRAAADQEYRERAAEHRYWWEIAKHFAPAPGTDVLHPLYVEALRRLPALEYWLDEHMGR